MNEQDTPTPGSEVGTQSHGTAVRLDEGHVVGTGGVPERFVNPGGWPSYRFVGSMSRSSMETSSPYSSDHGAADSCVRWSGEATIRRTSTPAVFHAVADAVAMRAPRSLSPKPGSRP